MIVARQIDWRTLAPGQIFLAEVSAVEALAKFFGSSVRYF
jgi:hypothetical protein